MEVMMTVKDSKMYLCVQVGGAVEYIPYKEAERLRGVLEVLIPYKFGQLVNQVHRFDADEENVS